MKRILVAAVLVAGFAGPAFAGHCPKDVALIDAELAKQSNAEAKELRDKGAAAHAAGQHTESLADLHKAMELLGISH